MTGRDRRAVLFGASIVLGAVLLLRVVPGGVRWVLASQRELRQRAELLGHAHAELAQAGALGDSGGQLTRALAGLASKLLVGGTRAEAGADLATRLSLVAARHQVKLERVDQLADSAAAGRLRRIAVRVALESDIRGISGLLQALASGDVALPVEALRIVAPDPGGAAAGAEVLKGEVTVAGWYLSDRGLGSGTQEAAR